MKADDLDHLQDLRLGAAQADRPPSHPKAAGEHGEIHHHRAVGEHQFAEVDDHVRFSAYGPYQRTAPTTLSRPVLVPAAAQRCGGVIEIDDGTETYTNRAVRRKG